MKQYLSVVPFYTVLIGLEAWWLEHQGEAYSHQHTRTSLRIGLGYLAGKALSGFILIPLFMIAWEHRLFTAPQTWWAYGVLFVGQEFFFYWYHRMSHENRFAWLSHSVHHSSPVMNLGAAYRLPWNGFILSGCTIMLPMVYLGYTPFAVLTALNLNLFYQFWLHTTLVPRLRWFGLVFNTPSHHRVHHARNALYIDKNYGSVLIIFDRLFGSFAEERDDVPCDYGLAGGNDNEQSALKLALGDLVTFAADLRAARTWSHRMGYFWRPPGWRPAPLAPLASGSPGPSLAHPELSAAPRATAAGG